jgi:hypothetical protein
VKKFIFNKKWSVLFILVSAFIIYSAASNIFINKESYRKKAWNYVSQDNSIFSWESVLNLESAQVERVKLSKKHDLFPQKGPEKFNRLLLNINGYYAIKVTFNTEASLLGPITIYLNPVTKQIIGYELRES